MGERSGCQHHSQYCDATRRQRRGIDALPVIGVGGTNSVPCESPIWMVMALKSLLAFGENTTLCGRRTALPAMVPKPEDRCRHSIYMRYNFSTSRAKGISPLSFCRQPRTRGAFQMLPDLFVLARRASGQVIVRLTIEGNFRALMVFAPGSITGVIGAFRRSAHQQQRHRRRCICCCYAAEIACPPTSRMCCHWPGLRAVMASLFAAGEVLPEAVKAETKTTRARLLPSGPPRLAGVRPTCRVHVADARCRCGVESISADGVVNCALRRQLFAGQPRRPGIRHSPFSGATNRAAGV